MYAHRYTEEDKYDVIHKYNGGERVVSKDQHDYVAWIKAGGIPEIEANGRFLSVVNGELRVDPDKDEILKAEAVALKAKKEREKNKSDTISANLPSWSGVESDIDNAESLKPIIKKLARVLYWLAKDSEE